MDASRRSQLVAMEEEQKHDDAQPAPPPPPQPSAPTLASCLALLAGASDEHKVAGLLLLARQDGAALASVAADVSAKLAGFLARLLRTGGDGDALTAAQRAGLHVTAKLASSADGARAALRADVLPAVGELAGRAADAATVAERGDGGGGGGGDGADGASAAADGADGASAAADGADGAAAVGCLAALVAGDPEALAASGVHGSSVVALAAASDDGGWADVAALLRVAAAGGLLGTPELARVAALAGAVRGDARFWAREARLIEAAALGASTLAGPARPAALSSESAAALGAARAAVCAALPRLLLRGGAAEADRDAALGAAAVAAAGFGDDWLAEKDGAVLRLVARSAAAEARLALDEAVALFEADAAWASGRLERAANVAPLCLGLLERLARTLVGERGGDSGSDDDSDDGGGGGDLAARCAPDALLDVRAALYDAADAALGFAVEARLLRDALASGVRPRDAKGDAALAFALGLCRAAFSFLGLLAAEDEDGGGAGDDLSLRARLDDLRPFVADLIALDRAPPLAPAAPAPAAAPAGDSDDGPDSDDDDMDFGT